MQAINDLETIVLSAFATITPTDCQQWYWYLLAKLSLVFVIVEVSLIH